MAGGIDADTDQNQARHNDLLERHGFSPIKAPVGTIPMAGESRGKQTSGQFSDPLPSGQFSGLETASRC
ncbi:hypothetical protein AZA_48249 [Nitrospirillum viridazoti Y2]|nr:hypothetical protein AZA_48249 [Nitrospirillum amazonense Y2]